ncbi:Gfo/Idh/MocA family oxidoreductase [Bradyrhizobium sp.]|uniref:Gfo/Idh/MocA family oxidoreductase n=1 Tax=Bradyrhizobium sp. TaxID=376 RepID=UPI0025BEE4BD|nr:Gfo/Idh/MocA family oxidoreductase [Bradyrhizobium sp.]
MKFAVLGSGFGLYGYVPALISGCNQEVYLPARYRVRLRERVDVRPFEDVIQWRADEAAILQEVDAVVISRRPQDQEQLIHRHLGAPNLRAFVLEKPLGTTPGSALEVLDTLEAAGKSYRIAYVFRYLPWAVLLKQTLEKREAPGSIRIVWRFRAHHYAHALQNWKRSVSDGGGALRFFGIQLIGLLAEIGYRNVTGARCTSSRRDECETWSAGFGGQGLPHCRVDVETNATTKRFSIEIDESPAGSVRIVDLEEPFQQCAQIGGLDRRVAALSELCHELIDGRDTGYGWYRGSLALWDQCERHLGRENG